MARRTRPVSSTAPPSAARGDGALGPRSRVDPGAPTDRSGPRWTLHGARARAGVRGGGVRARAIERGARRAGRRIAPRDGPRGARRSGGGAAPPRRRSPFERATGRPIRTRGPGASHRVLGARIRVRARARRDAGGVRREARERRVRGVSLVGAVAWGAARAAVPRRARRGPRARRRRGRVVRFFFGRERAAARASRPRRDRQPPRRDSGDVGAFRRSERGAEPATTNATNATIATPLPPRRLFRGGRGGGAPAAAASSLADGSPGGRDVSSRARRRARRRRAGGALVTTLRFEVGRVRRRRVLRVRGGSAPRALSAGVAVPRLAAAEAVATPSRRALEDRPGDDASLGSAATQAAAAAGLAAMRGGSWCLAGASSRGPAFVIDPVAGGGGGAAGVGGSDSAFVAAPLLWSHRLGGGGGAGPGTRAVKRCVAALEQPPPALGGGGASSSTRRADQMDPRARDVAARGLALAADAAVAEAAARAKGSGGGAGGRVVRRPGFYHPRAPNRTRARPPSRRASDRRARWAPLAEAALGFRGASDDARYSEEEANARRSARRALVALAGVERLPPGDWAGALRRRAGAKARRGKKNAGDPGARTERGGQRSRRPPRFGTRASHSRWRTRDPAPARRRSRRRSRSATKTTRARAETTPTPPPRVRRRRCRSRGAPRVAAGAWRRSPAPTPGAALLRACERVAANLPEHEGSSSKGGSYAGRPRKGDRTRDRPRKGDRPRRRDVVGARGPPRGARLVVARGPSRRWRRRRRRSRARRGSRRRPGARTRRAPSRGSRRLSRGQRSDDEEAKRRGLRWRAGLRARRRPASARHGAISHPSPLRARLAARGAIDASDVPPLDAWRPRANLSATLRVLAPALARDDRAGRPESARGSRKPREVRASSGGDARIVGGGDKSSCDDVASRPWPRSRRRGRRVPWGRCARARAASRRGAPELGGRSAEDAADARASSRACSPPSSTQSDAARIGRGRSTRSCGARRGRRGLITREGAKGGRGMGLGSSRGTRRVTRGRKTKPLGGIFLDASPAGLAASAVRDAASRETWAEHAWRL